MTPDSSGPQESAGQPPSQPSEPKLTAELGSLRASRPMPARYNGRIAALAAGGAAIFVVGALFIPPILAKDGHHKTANLATNNSAPPIAPIQPITYDGAPADPSSGPNSASPGVDCSQYPGMPGCAAANAAAAAAIVTASAPAATGVAGVAGAPAGAAPAAVNPPAQPAGLSIPGSDKAASARSSGVFFGGSLASAGQALTHAPGGPPVAAGPPMPPPSPSGFGFPSPDNGQPADVMAQNGQGEKAAFAKLAATADYVEGRIQKPKSPYEVKAGAVIPAALLTAINSDLPGQVIAQVTQPVYDHVSGRYVLIPQGSRIIGRYDSQVAYGQTRAMVIWHRVIFPNGNSINFGNMGATDATGAAGVSDRVINHFGSLAQGIVLSTLLSMGAASAQDAGARSSGTLVLNAGAAGAANEAETVGSRLTNRELNRQPTIEIRQGAQVRVLVDKDIVLEPYS